MCLSSARLGAFTHTLRSEKCGEKNRTSTPKLVGKCFIKENDKRSLSEQIKKFLPERQTGRKPRQTGAPDVTKTILRCLSTTYRIGMRRTHTHTWDTYFGSVCCWVNRATTKQWWYHKEDLGMELSLRQDITDECALQKPKGKNPSKMCFLSALTNGFCICVFVLEVISPKLFDEASRTNQTSPLYKDRFVSQQKNRATRTNFLLCRRGGLRADFVFLSGHKYFGSVAVKLQFLHIQSDWLRTMKSLGRVAIRIGQKVPICCQEFLASSQKMGQS